jgi:limonene-1,2-epoxide hydrolase
MSDNSSIVVDFINAWIARDYEKVMSHVAEDCVYHNIPMEPTVGRENISLVIKGFIDMSKEIDWTVHHIAESSDGVVLTERSDRFLIGEKWISIGVMGVFELKGGEITGWRDYFDLGQFNSQMSG